MATPPESASAAPPRVTRKFVISVAAAALLVIGGAAFYLLRGNQVQAATAVQPVKPIFVALEPLTVNLQSDGRPKFLHLGVVLKVSDETAQSRISESMPELRSRLLLLLSDRAPASFATPADKVALAEQIKAELNRPLAPGLPPYGITGVVFNAFVVQ